MTLGELQELFAELIVKQLQYIHSMGYKTRLGHLMRCENCLTGRAKSNHKIKLALDINLFKNGVWLDKTSDHQELGRHWEALHPLCIWGGNWDKDNNPMEFGEGDGNHYSLMYNGRA